MVPSPATRIIAPGMPKSKKTLKIFFASSGTLEPFRLEFEHVVNQIGKWHDHLHLDVVKWETDIESGSYDGKNVQAEINPLLEDCEVVVVAVYDRIGKFTLEEYHLARSLGKKVFVYFFNRQPDPDDAVSQFWKQLDAENLSSERKIDYTADAFRYRTTVDLQTYLTRQRVEQLPNGFEWVFPKENLKPATTLRYQNFLQDNVLPYFSRDQFKAREKCPGNFLTETDILTELLTEQPNEEARYHGCIIYGAGGIGKTRLMFELGLRSLALNWLPVQVASKVEDVESLAPHLKRGKKYVLLFDYIEESRGFNSDIPAVLSEKTGAIVRVIANCRYTFSSSSNFPTESTFLPLHLDTNDAFQQQYEDAVIQHILREIKVELGEERLRFHLIKPSFAVFLRFLWFNQHKNLITNDIRKFGDFEDWIKHRMQLTFGLTDFRRLDREVIYSLTLLPAPRTQIFSDSKRRDFLQEMISDGWVEVSDAEDQEPVLLVIHDTITDELLGIHLKSKRGDLEGEVEAILDYAAKNELLHNCWRAFERIRGQVPGFKEDTFYKLLRKKLIRTPESMSAMREMLGITELLNETQRIRIILEFRDFFLPYLTTAQFAKPLCFAMNACAKGKTGADTSRQLREIFQIWYAENADFNAFKSLEYRVISTYIKLFGIDAEATGWVKRYVERPAVYYTASYVIAAWLRQGGDPGFIEQLVKTYLRIFKSGKEIRYVLATWLYAGGAKEAVEPGLKTYLAHNAREKETSFVFQAWLDTGGAKEIVEARLRLYLEQNAGEREASYIIKAWLDNGGAKEVVEGGMKQYLEHYGAENDARFVYTAWLDAGEDKEVVEVGIKRYLEQHAAEKEASFILKAWLDMGGDKAVVESSLKCYLEHNAAENDARFVFRSWLDAGGAKEVIEGGLKQYLKQNAVEKKASFVFQAWLNTGGDKDIIERDLKRYLAQNAAEDDARFIYKSWLDVGGSMEVIEAGLKQYLHQNAQKKEASYVFQSWLDAGGEKTTIEDGLKRYLEQNAVEDDARFVYKSWLNAGGSQEFLEVYLKRYLDQNATENDARFVYKAWLDAGGSKKIIETYLKQYLEQNFTEKEVSFVFQSWLDAGGAKEVVEAGLIRYLEQNSVEHDARFIYKAWLDADGSKVVVEAGLKDYLNQYSTEKEASFIFQSWLEAGGAKETVETALRRYLEYNAVEPNARFVFQSWLNAGGAQETVEVGLKRYLEQNAAEKEAQFVYKSWLDAGGARKAVEVGLKRYLEKNATEKEAQFAIKAWLDAGGAQEIVEAGLKRYLEKNATEKEAQFAIKAWLDAGGSKSVVEAGLKRYLEKNATERESTFIFQSWLNTGGSLSAVEAGLNRYLEKNATEKEASFIFQSWLDAGGSKDVVELGLKTYLEHHASDKDARFVFKSWLDAGGAMKTIEAGLKTYLTHHATEKEASFVFHAWLDKGGDLGTIRGALSGYLQKHATSAEARFVLASWLKRNGDKGLIEPALIRYLDEYCLEKDTAFVFSAWVKSNGTLMLLEQYLNRYLPVNAAYHPLFVFYLEAMPRAVYREFVRDWVLIWLSDQIHSEKWGQVLWTWLETYQDTQAVQYLLHEYLPLLDKHGMDKQATYVYQAWLRVLKDPAPLQPYLAQWLRQNETDIKTGHIYELLLVLRQLTPPLDDLFLHWYNTFAGHPIAEDLHRRYNLK
jgi:DNA gyrase inhibitor GyrI